jgi:ribA/ribD-fused uncharacterized protein
MSTIYNIFDENSIETFRGEHVFLSNFYFSFVLYNDIVWKTAEHAYQASKTLDPKEKKWIIDCPTPHLVKEIGKKLTLREDWNNVKVQIMRDIIYEKFEYNKSIKEKLIATHPYILIEGNLWHDNFWGVCKCEKCKKVKVKHNHLGFILMELRNRYVNENLFFKE